MPTKALKEEEALAVLMSIPDVNNRRDYVAEDLEGERRLASIDRLALALVLEVPFGMDRKWRRMCRVKLPVQMTNEAAVECLKSPDKGSLIIEHFDRRMPERRYNELNEAFGAFLEAESNGLAFNFTFAELREISDLLASDLGYDLGGEQSWSQDAVVSPSGVELGFLFSMLSRSQLLGCLAGPYDDLDDLDPSEYGLREMDW